MLSFVHHELRRCIEFNWHAVRSVECFGRYYVGKGRILSSVQTFGAEHEAESKSYAPCMNELGRFIKFRGCADLRAMVSGGTQGEDTG